MRSVGRPDGVGPEWLLTSPPSTSTHPVKWISELGSHTCETIIPSAPIGYTATFETVSKSAVSFNAPLYSRIWPNDCFSLGLGKMVTGKELANQIRFLRPGTAARYRPR